MENITNLQAKVESDIDEIMSLIMGKIDKKAIKDMGADEFMLVKTIFNLVDSTTKLIGEYGRTIDEINRKIDTLIKRGDQE
jgi:flagellar capping protein FliD